MFKLFNLPTFNPVDQAARRSMSVRLAVTLLAAVTGCATSRNNSPAVATSEFELVVPIMDPPYPERGQTKLEEMLSKLSHAREQARLYVAEQNAAGGSTARKKLTTQEGGMLVLLPDEQPERMEAFACGLQKSLRQFAGPRPIFSTGMGIFRDRVTGAIIIPDGITLAEPSGGGFRFVMRWEKQAFGMRMEEEKTNAVLSPLQFGLQIGFDFMSPENRVEPKLLDLID